MHFCKNICKKRKIFFPFAFLQNWKIWMTYPSILLCLFTFITKYRYDTHVYICIHIYEYVNPICSEWMMPRGEKNKYEFLSLCHNHICFINFALWKIFVEKKHWRLYRNKKDKNKVKITLMTVYQFDKSRGRTGA